jgi:hypothetical protein
MELLSGGKTEQVLDKSFAKLFLEYRQRLERPFERCL